MKGKFLAITLCIMLLNFSIQQKVQGLAPAAAAGGSGAYVVGALAVGGLAGVFGYAEHAEEINAHALRVWDKTTELTKDAWNSSVTWVGSLFPDLTGENYEIDYGSLTLELGGQAMDATKNLVRQTVNTAVPSISQKEYEKTAISTPVSGNSIGTTKYPNVSISRSSNYVKTVYITLTDEKFFVIPKGADLPVLYKTLKISGNSVSNNYEIQASVGNLDSNGTYFAKEYLTSPNITTREWLSGGLNSAVISVETALGIIGSGAINDIYIGDQTVIDQINAANSLALEQAYRDFLPNVGTNTGRLSIPFPQGKLGVGLPDLDLPAGSDVIYNPADDLWYTPDGVAVGNPSGVIVQPYPNTKVIEHPVTGVPTLVFETPHGYVNVGTGELITTGNPAVPIDPDVPAPKPPETDLSRPTRKLDFTPLFMTGETFTRKFPFSIPWDLKNQFGVFNVSNETPKFLIDKPNFIQLGGKSIPFELEISLEQFEPIATATRWFFLIAFDVGIILLMRRLMPE